MRGRELIRRYLLKLTGPLLSRGASETILPQPSNILVIRPDHLGDLLFATPALRLLRHSFPDAHITCLIGPWGESVLRGNPHLDEVLLCPFPGFTRQPKPSLLQPYALLLTLARELRTRGFDTALILRFDHWWGAILATLAQIPHRIGYAIPEVKPFLSYAVPYEGKTHEVVRNLLLVAGLAGVKLEDVTPEKYPLEFHFTSEDVAYVDKLAGPGPFVAIHPGAGWPVKLWLPEKWAALADAIAQKWHRKVVLTGSASERPLTEEIARRMRSHPLNLGGRTTIGQLAALYSRCELVIGCDSGPLHLAVGVGVPTIHLYGPVDPELFGPWGPKERHRVVRADMECIPCNRLDYRDEELSAHLCVKAITVEQVLATVEEILTPSSGGFYGHPERSK